MQEEEKGMIFLKIISSTSSVLASKILYLLWGKLLQLSADHHARGPLCKL